LCLGETKELAGKYIGLGLIRDRVLPITGITKHQYYYQPKKTRPGREASTITIRLVSGEKKEETNEQVVDQIINLQDDPDTNYGYRKMYFALMMMGYYINHKKVYRLMKEHKLLKKKYKRAEKNYAEYRIVTPRAPLQVFEMDIKYVWIAQARRHCYILTIIDTFTRFVLNWQVDFSMKSQQIKQAWEEVIVNYLQEADLLKREVHVEIRNDNGPQFGAKMIMDFFKENFIDQVFTHPYTPQENGHIESFHSILSRSIENEAFWSISDLVRRLEKFYDTYNNSRLHSSIANLTPKLFWKLWNKGLISSKEMKNKILKFSLNIPYQQIPDNENLKGVPCLNYQLLDAIDNLQKEANGSETLQQPPAQKSPLVVPC